MKTKLFLLCVLVVATLTGCSEAESAEPLETLEEGVIINGIMWATHNVDEPGKFATSVTDAGMFYQWNRKVGWSSTDPMEPSTVGVAWDDTRSQEDMKNVLWTSEKNPCPLGWKVPTNEDFDKLCDEIKVEKNPNRDAHGKIIGYRFQDKTNTKNEIYISNVSGYRNHKGGLVEVGIKGYCWSSTSLGGSGAHHLIDGKLQQCYDRAYAMPVRCVEDTKLL